MNNHTDLVKTTVERWNDIRAAIGGQRRPTPLTVLNAVGGLPGVNPAVTAAANAVRTDLPEATKVWRKNVKAFTQVWQAIGGNLDAAPTAGAMVAALDATTAAGAPVNLAPAKALVQAGAPTVYDPAFVAAQPAPAGGTDVAALLHTGVRAAVKGVVAGNGTSPEAVAVAASFTDLVGQLW